MIRSIDIENFRCYKRMKIEDCSRLNVIVGDNGSGKTSLLEAIFLTLASSTEVAARFHEQRGFEGRFAGSPRRIEQALWGDLFHNFSFARPIRISLLGNGPETRSLVISRGAGEATLPLESSKEPSHVEPIRFMWTDHRGVERAVTPVVTAGGLHLAGTGEENPDFFYFAAGQQVPALENAARFSEIEDVTDRKRFIEIFSKEYGWIEDINIEVSGGSAVLYARLKNEKEKMPLPALSGGINKTIAIMLAIASHPRSVLLIDEIENGVYHKHLTAVWRGMLAFMREFGSQLFVTTHSAECLRALVRATGKSESDITLWRTIREKSGAHIIQRFSGKDLAAAIRMESDVR